MISRQKRAPKQTLVSFTGGVAYLSIILQWVWTGVVLLPSLLQIEAIRNLFLPQPVEQTKQVAEATSSSPLMIAIAAVITLVVIIACAVILIRLPIAAARGARAASITATAAVLPVVTQKRKMSEKKQRRLSAIFLWWTKFTAALLPSALIWLIYLLPSNQLLLPAPIAIFVASILAIGSFIWLITEYGLARILKIPIEKIF